MQRIFFSFGSNLGNKYENIENTYKKIESRIGDIVSQSDFYITEPIGFKSNNLFVNSACEVHSNINIIDIFAESQLIEKEIGRVEKSRNLKFSDRIIDIDLILADNLIINTPNLTIPHPRFHTRHFVLAPLCEIAPDMIHPIFKKTISELLQELEEQSKK